MRIVFLTRRVQAQALVVGQLAAVFAIVLSWITQWKFDVRHCLLLCTSSVLTAAIASFILSTLMPPSLTTTSSFLLLLRLLVLLVER